jgi:hypothetical protein
VAEGKATQLDDDDKGDKRSLNKSCPLPRVEPVRPTPAAVAVIIQ